VQNSLGLVSSVVWTLTCCFLYKYWELPWRNYVYFQSGRIGADEEIDDTKGKTMEEIDEMIEERELKAGTQILEMVFVPN